MVRTQIQLTDDQAKTVKKLGHSPWRLHGLNSSVQAVEGVIPT